MGVSYGSGGVLPVDFEATNPAIRVKVSKMNAALNADATNVALGSNATFTGLALGVYLTAAGGVLAGGSGSLGLEGRAALAGYIFADQGGTYNQQVSYANATYRNLASTAYAASTVLQKTTDLRGVPYSRAAFTNGAAAQGTFEFNTCYGPGN
jgi:hypothetical protein